MVDAALIKERVPSNAMGRRHSLIRQDPGRAHHVAIKTMLGRGDADTTSCRPRKGLYETSAENLTEITALIDTGRIKVGISERYALDDISKAEARRQEGGVRPKILVEID
jgi:NADPH:quinone reductase-like Zn-dependent oxidoreductase